MDPKENTGSVNVIDKQIAIEDQNQSEIEETVEDQSTIVKDQPTVEDQPPVDWIPEVDDDFFSEDTNNSWMMDLIGRIRENSNTANKNEIHVYQPMHFIKQYHSAKKKINSQRKYSKEIYEIFSKFDKTAIPRNAKNNLNVIKHKKRIMKVWIYFI